MKRSQHRQRYSIFLALLLTFTLWTTIVDAREENSRVIDKNGTVVDVQEIGHLTLRDGTTLLVINMKQSQEAFTRQFKNGTSNLTTPVVTFLVWDPATNTVMPKNLNFFTDLPNSRYAALDRVAWEKELGAGRAAAQAVGRNIPDTNSGCNLWWSGNADKISVSWTGACVDGKADGAGTAKWNSEGKPLSQYDGNYKDGKMNGAGKLKVAGTEYSGEFKDDLMHGKGIVLIAGGSKYEGNFKEGKMWNGVLTVPDGSCAVFADGVKRNATLADQRLFDPRYCASLPR